MQIEGSVVEAEENGLTCEGVEISSVDPPDGGQCTSEEVGEMAGNNESTVAPDPPTSMESSPQGEGLQQEEVESELKEEQSQEEAAAAAT